METPQIDVVRAYAPRTVLRAADAEAEAAMPTMEVRFSTFDTWYEIDSWLEGEFLERTTKGAFAQTISEDRDSIKVLYDHGFDYQIGNKVLGPIDDLREDDDSPVGVVPLFDTMYNRELLPGLEAGVYGSSFRFRVTGETWDDEPEPSGDNPRGLPERTITKVRLFEFGPVTFPANPESTAKLRSLTDSYYERLLPREPQAYDAALRAAGRSKPDFTGRPGARSTGGGGTDSKPQGGDLSSVSNQARTRDRVLRMTGVIK